MTDALVADIQSEPWPASNRNRWPASDWNTWPASSESTIHIRYDIETGLYDPHIHVVCNVTDDDLDTVNIELARRFSDPWQEREPIREPGALMNYLHLWMFNHREVALWPKEAIVEVWELPRVRLSRPAGPFAAFRREVKDKLLDRENGKIVVRERPAKPTRGTSRRRSVPLSDDEAHVVAIRDVRIGGQKRRCAIIKRPRASSVQEPAPSAGRPTVVVPPVSARWLRRLRVYLDTALPMPPPVLCIRPLAKAVQVLAHLWMVACLFTKVGPSARALPCADTQVQSPRSLAPVCEVEHRARGPPCPGPGGPLRARVSRPRVDSPTANSPLTPQATDGAWKSERTWSTPPLQGPPATARDEASAGGPFRCPRGRSQWRGSR